MITRWRLKRCCTGYCVTRYVIQGEKEKYLEEVRMRFMMFRLHITAAQRRFLVAVLLALGLAFAFPAVSEAHAILLRSDPTKDAVLSVAPHRVCMWFSEELNPAV